MEVVKYCRCRCGYRCGGPGRCALSITDCLATDDGKHFVKDCDHDWTGDTWTSDDGLTSSVTCKTCGLAAIHHDMRCGP
jgi:hypothetical protein